jgi:uncharacterized protein (DUF305 family)
MIAHYESSIKTAGIMLADGSDPLLRSLADGIIASHQRDLDVLRKWLANCDSGGKPGVANITDRSSH